MDFFYDYETIVVKDIHHIIEHVREIYMELEKLTLLYNQIRALEKKETLLTYRKRLKSYHERMFQLFDQVNLLVSICENYGYQIHEVQEIELMHEHLHILVRQAEDPLPSAEFLQDYYQGRKYYETSQKRDEGPNLS
jgi:hypothetical protein